MKVFALLCLIGISVGYTIEKNPQVADNEWFVWRLTHKKAYKDLDEERVRYAIWKDNTQYINEFNNASHRIDNPHVIEYMLNPPAVVS